MKHHNLKITLILLAMFITTQFIGIYVVDYYSPVKFFQGHAIEIDSPDLPFGLETPELEDNEFNQMFVFVIFAFIIAILLLFFLSKLDMAFIMRLWFFIVVIIALGISFTSFLFRIGSQEIQLFSSVIPLPWLIALILAIPLAFIKIYKRDFFIHNSTELFIYPGIAAVFVPILNVYTIVAPPT
jgi:presenilin-like A22 family membrane protease|tara:strand:- start:135 stop:686 length:552 start_codon:yes stop_codon:yes gene_type:complete